MKSEQENQVGIHVQHHGNDRLVAAHYRTLRVRRGEAFKRETSRRKGDAEERPSA